MERVQRFVFEHRRSLAALFAGLAVLLGLGSLRESPAGTEVVVAARDLPSGTVLTAADLRTASLPPAAVPAEASTDARRLVGRLVGAPVREREMLTDWRLLDPRDLDAYGEGLVLATVRVAAPDEVAMLRAGDVVDVVAVDPQGEDDAVVVARAASVVAVPPATDHGVPLQVVVGQDEALALATAGVTSRFSVLTTPSTPR